LVPHPLGGVITHIPDGSGSPAPTAVHVPAVPPGGLQVSQTPSQAWSQQTLSWLQVRPAAHWFVLLQVPPFWIRPHEPFTQVLGLVQSAFVVHELTHIKAVASQRPGAQPWSLGVTHFPAPSQWAGGVWAGEGGPPASQLPALQTVLVE
jgi:hypothetical protein